MGFIRLVAAACALTALATSAQSQSYPNRPVRVLVGFAAGSGPDVLARAVSAQLAIDLGQQFVIENRTGANGTIANRVLTQSDTDGYTLMFSSSSITPTPYVYKNLPYDLIRDIKPVASIGVLDGFLMLVNPSLPVKTVPEFIAYAKANRVLYGSPGVGNILHLAAEQFNVKAGLKMEHVPFKGASEVNTALLANSINVMFVTPPSVIGLVKDGKLRPLAYTGGKPFPEFPDVPLMTASVPDYPVRGSWGMFFAPSATPQPIVERLNAAIRKALREPLVANVVQRAGYVPDERDAAATATFFRAEVEEAGEAVRAAGIAAE